MRSCDIIMKEATALRALVYALEAFFLYADVAFVTTQEMWNQWNTIRIELLERMRRHKEQTMDALSALRQYKQTWDCS